MVTIAISLWVIVTVTFILMRLLPGGPFRSEKALPEAIERAINARYHLNDPLLKQYLDYMRHLLHWDLGPSFKYAGRTVNEIIRESFPVSAILGGTAIAFALLAGIPMGVISAMKQNKWQDYLFMFFATIGVSAPSFIIASLLMWVFAFKLHVLPAATWGDVQHAILPTLSLAGFSTAIFARLTRASMLDVLGQDYVRTARSKGLSGLVVIYRHCLKNALLPVVTFLGPLAAGVLTGSFVVESIFAIPGLGRHFVTSISNRDYTVILGVTIFYATLLVLFNFIVDLLYAVIDPRIKIAGAKE